MSFNPVFKLNCALCDDLNYFLRLISNFDLFLLLSRLSSTAFAKIADSLDPSKLLLLPSTKAGMVGPVLKGPIEIENI